MTDETAERRSWLAVPIHVLGWTVLLLDLWGTVFWARFGGGLGWGVASVGAVVAVLLGAALVLDLRERISRRSGEDAVLADPAR